MEVSEKKERTEPGSRVLSPSSHSTLLHPSLRSGLGVNVENGEDPRERWGWQEHRESIPPIDLTHRSFSSCSPHSLPTPPYSLRS